ncbi:hypothetical protein KEM56_005990, partial [Ascosphaera pollenicola]
IKKEEKAEVLGLFNSIARMVATIRIIGSLNVDTVTVTPRFPGPGETLTATSFNILAGGKGANQAVACGRLSRNSPKDDDETPSESDVNVEMIGAVGGKHKAEASRNVSAFAF